LNGRLMGGCGRGVVAVDDEDQGGDQDREGSERREGGHLRAPLIALQPLPDRVVGRCDA
jgi:hypothetical protein